MVLPSLCLNVLAGISIQNTIHCITPIYKFQEFAGSSPEGKIMSVSVALGRFFIA